MAIAWTKSAMAVMPRIITRRDRIKSVPRRFAEQYPNGDKQSHTGAPYADLHQALAELDLETCKRQDVDKIIGNDSWTALRCDVCDNDREAVVSIPREYDSAIAVCADCGRGVLSVFENSPA